MNRFFQVNNRKRRTGFTLVELLVVIGIILLLTVAAAPVAFSMLNGRAIREASSSVQAVLAGARDRAAFAREARGVRLVTDTATGNPSLVREIRYIRPAAPLSTGSAIVVDSNWNNPWNDYTVPFPPGAMVGPQPVGSSWINNTAPPANPIFSLVVLLGCQDKDRLKSLPFRMAGSTRVYFGVIRLATSGQLLGFSTTDAMIDTVIGGINFPYLRLDRPLPRPVPFDELRLGQLPHRSALIPPAGMQMLDYLPHVGVEYQIPIGFVELEGENPIKLPSGVVIDLGYIDPTGAAAPDPTGVRLSRLQPEYQHWDIVFAPNGQVIGAAAAEAHIFLWLRDELAATEDITVPVATAPSGFMRVIPVNNSGNHAIVAIAARTGLIRSVEPNFGTAIGSASTATMDAALAPGASFEYWNYRSLYDLYFSQLSAPDGGETGL